MINFRTEIVVHGDAEFGESGINLNLNKQSNLPQTKLEGSYSVDSENKLTVNGSSTGIAVLLWPDGSNPVPNTKLTFAATAREIHVTGGTSQAIYANGNGLQSTDTNGTHVNLQATTTTLEGGGSYGGTHSDNIAVYATQGSVVNLLSADEPSSLKVIAKQVNEANPNAYGNISLFSDNSSVNVQYGEGSELQFEGGLFAMGDRDNSAEIKIETGEASNLVLNGNIIGVSGDVDLNVTGSAKITAPTVMLQSGQISIAIDADDSNEESGVVGNLLAVYGDTAYGPSHIALRLSGARNVFTGTSTIDEFDPQYNIIDVELKNGARWDVVSLGEDNNYVTDLKLDGGTVNLPYGQAEGTYKQVDAVTLSGTGGTINFNLALNGEVEANDKLVVQRTEQGSHTVHVDVHQGFEPTTMSGYLIHADADDGVTFTADDNPLEAGAFLYSYTVESKAGPVEGQTEWFISFDEYKEPEQPLSPSGEAVVAMAGMGAQNAMYLTQLSDLRKRLGEVRNGVRDGLWASVAGQKDRISGFRGTGFKQEAYRFNFGYDRSIGDWILGANLKAMTAGQETKDGNFSADGDAHSEGVNIYASYLQESGGYADFVLSVDRYHQTIDTNMLNGVSVDGSYHNWGLGLSVELGHQFDFSKTWFIEPQAQLSYYYLEGDEFRLSNGMKVDQSNFDGLTARLGVASGKTFFAPDGDYKGQIYARLGVKHELLGDQTIRVNDIKFEDDLLGTRVYYGFGVDWLLSEKVKLFGHVERENGSNYTKEFDFNVGIKYSF